MSSTDPASPLPPQAPPVRTRPPAPWNLPANPLFRRYFRSRLRPRPFGISLTIVLIIATFMTVFLPMAARKLDEQRSLRAIQGLAAFEKFHADQSASEAIDKRRTLSLEDLKQRAEMAITTERTRLRLKSDAARPLPPDYTYYRIPLLTLLALQAGLLFLAGTGQVAGGMTAEADEGSVDSVRLTPLTPLTKTLGYLFGLPVREYVLALFTLPFTAWCLWKGEIGPEHWAPVYGVFFLTGILYHLTGLVSGTVLKSKRWAFLLSMGLVFVLYSVVPWGARIGFPFVRFLTVWPVLAHEISAVQPQLAPGVSLASGGDATKTGVPFFGMTFSELAFTLMVQGTFVLTMLVMVWRKWKRPESHLLSKIWGLGLFLWINALVVGSALPMAESGDLFPSRTVRQNAKLRNELRQEFFEDTRNNRNRGHNQSEQARAQTQALELLMRTVENSRPQWGEAVLISGIYAILLLGVMIMKLIMLTPGNDGQQRGLRRALRLGKSRAPPGSDEASGFPSTVILVLIAVAAWVFFHRGLAATAWFAAGNTGDALGASAALAIVLTLTCLTFQSMLESGGHRGTFIAVVFVGIVPLLAAAIASVGGAGPETSWAVASISPLSHIVYAVSLLNPDPRYLPAPTARICFWIWSALALMFLLTRLQVLRQSWARRRNLMQVREGRDTDGAINQGD